ncbi:CgeB family protein [Terrilactibacillus laevilacticus]|uniref:CgeB family protein n=1 Tax=Terrilactibacillus laevilacticus TaxID=1380157 RepID=UPI001147880F|nr:glycosyltransferase [Terrilactibacillus laevilacticus]
MNNLKILCIVANWRGANDGSFANAFKEIGCSVSIINVKDYFGEFSISERIYKKLFKVPLKNRIELFNKAIIGSIDNYKPTLLFVAKGLWVRPETIKYAKEKSIITLHWHPDDAFNPENSSYLLNKANLIYDLLITPKSFNVKEYQHVGAKKVLYLPYCFDPNIHYPVKLKRYDIDKYKSDMVFVGAMRKKRLKELKKISHLECNLSIWGTGWEKIGKFNNIKRYCKNKPVFAEEMSKVFQSSKIVLGFLNAENRDLHTARTFEVPACKGFLLAERTIEHQEIFKEGIEADFFDDLDELKEKISFYINNEKIRWEIAERGFFKVKKLNATYRRRAEQILEELDLGVIYEG